jgi:alpha(1,3/1,4) fucosyltransferase
VSRKVKNIAWVPYSSDSSQNRLFNLSSVRDNATERFVEAHGMLTDNGLTSNTIDQCDLTKVDVVIFYNFISELGWLIKTIKKNPAVQFINIPAEPPVVSPLHEKHILIAMPFDRILVWNDNLVTQGLPFVKANIGEPVINVESIPLVPFRGKSFMVAICSNKLIKHKNGIHKERFIAFDFFSKKQQGMDLYGMGWEGVVTPFVKASYKGKCKTKKDVLKNYKFSICFENAKNYPGLITEKIFDCFAAGTVPIYYGPPNVQDYIPNDCFIDFCSFSNYEELYQFLINVTEVEYQAYLDATKRFIKSKEYYEFTSKRFAEIILEQIRSLLIEPKVNRTVLGFKWPLFKIVLSNPIFFLRNLKRCKRFLFDLFFSF